MAATTAPHPRPLPTRGRGERPAARCGTRFRTARPAPSPLWEGLGWGACNAAKDIRR